MQHGIATHSCHYTRLLLIQPRAGISLHTEGTLGHTLTIIDSLPRHHTSNYTPIKIDTQHKLLPLSFSFSLLPLSLSPFSSLSFSLLFPSPLYIQPHIVSEHTCSFTSTYLHKCRRAAVQPSVVPRCRQVLPRQTVHPPTPTHRPSLRQRLVGVGSTEPRSPTTEPRHPAPPPLGIPTCTRGLLGF